MDNNTDRNNDINKSQIKFFKTEIRLKILFYNVDYKRITAFEIEIPDIVKRKRLSLENN